MDNGLSSCSSPPVGVGTPAPSSSSASMSMSNNHAFYPTTAVAGATTPSSVGVGGGALSHNNTSSSSSYHLPSGLGMSTLPPSSASSSSLLPRSGALPSQPASGGGGGGGAEEKPHQGSGGAQGQGHQQQGQSTSLHLGDLEPWMDEGYVRECCARMGWKGVVGVKLIRGSNNSSGYAFLTFPSPSHASSILARYVAHPPVLMPRSGRTYKLNWATGLPGVQPTWEGEWSVFVGDLGKEVGEGELVALFTPLFPSTKSAKIMYDPSTGVSRGYGFIRFAEEGDMHRALLLGQNANSGNGLSLHGRTLRISEASGGSGGAGNHAPVTGAGQMEGNMLLLRERRRTKTSDLSTLGLDLGMLPPSSSLSMANSTNGPGGPYSAVPGFGQLHQNSLGDHYYQHHSSINGYGSPVGSFSPSPPGSAPVLSPSLPSAVSAQQQGGYTSFLPTPLSPLLSPTTLSSPRGGGGGGTGSGGPLSPSSAQSNFGAFSPRSSEGPGSSKHSPGGPQGMFFQSPELGRSLSQGGGAQGGQHHLNPASDPNNTTVFVGGLPACISEETLRSFFQHFGEITYCKIPAGKGCGFVQFVRRADAEVAIAKMHDFPIHGKSRIRLSWGRSQGDKQVEHVRKLAGALNIPFDSVWRMVQGKDGGGGPQQGGVLPRSGYPQQQQEQPGMSAFRLRGSVSGPPPRSGYGAVAHAAGLSAGDLRDVVEEDSYGGSMAGGGGMMMMMDYHGGGLRSPPLDPGAASFELGSSPGGHSSGNGPYSRVSPSAFSSSNTAFSPSSSTIGSPPRVMSSLPMPVSSSGQSSMYSSPFPPSSSSSSQDHYSQQQPTSVSSAFAPQPQHQQPTNLFAASSAAFPASAPGGMSNASFFPSHYTSINAGSLFHGGSPYERVDFAEAGMSRAS